MKILTRELLPKCSFSGFPLNHRKESDKLYVWYRKPQGGKIVEFRFPKTIDINKEFIKDLALCLGDGLNNPNKKNTHCSFSNKNIDLIKLVYGWWQDLGVPKEKINVYAFANSQSNIKSIKNKIATELNCKSIKVYTSDRHKSFTVFIQSGNSIFQSFYLNLFNKLKKDISTNSELRRAFLAGLFAAEGHVKHSIYGTLESISYSFNPKTEYKIAKFVKLCLKKENIISKISEGLIYFCNYEQMLRFFLLGITKLHNDKENKFKHLCKNIDLTIHFKNGFLNQLDYLSQIKLAKELGCSQSTISQNIKNKRFNLNLFKSAFPKFTNKEIIKNIDFAYVRTSKIENKETINFLIDLQSGVTNG